MNITTPTAVSSDAHHRVVATGAGTASSKSGQIRGLDGLRAGSVLAVLGFHLWPGVVPGGFLGVDVFFVISGFLITTLLLRELRSTERIDLASFWVRRARRLLPLVVLVTVASVGIARLVEPELLVGVRSEVLGSLTFSTNWIWILEGGDYFDHGAPSLFMTFWSLAVEEQFYLVWPLVFLEIHRRRVRMATAMRGAALAALASVTLMGVAVRTGASVSRVYYGTDTHLFGLMLGVALAYGAAGGMGLFRSWRWRRLRLWLPFVGTAVIVVLALTVSGESTGTYPFALVAASIAAALVVASLPGRPTRFTQIAEAPALAWLGSRSFGLYLWHWPVLVMLREVLMSGEPTADASLPVAVLTLALTGALTELSYRCIEMPIRQRGVAVALADLRMSLVAERGSLAARSSTVAGVVLVVMATIGVWGAASTSGAQASVEAGLAAIEAAQQTTTMSTAVPVALDPAVPTTPPPPPPPPPVWSDAVPPGEMIDGFGDSVMSGAAPALYERFPGIRLNAKPIRQWTAALDIVRSAIDAGGVREVVVLNFGTNAGLASENNRNALRSVLDLLGPDRRIVLFDIVGVSKWVGSSNETLRSIATEYPNVAVADWHMVVHTFPNLLHVDRTHPNMNGITAYAELLQQTLTKLGPGA